MDEKPRPEDGMIVVWVESIHSKRGRWNTWLKGIREQYGPGPFTVTSVNDLHNHLVVSLAEDNRHVKTQVGGLHYGSLARFSWDYLRPIS